MSQSVDQATGTTLFFDGEHEEQRRERFERMKQQTYELYAQCVEFGQYDALEVWDRWQPKAFDALHSAVRSMTKFSALLDEFIQHEAPLEAEYKKLAQFFCGLASAEAEQSVTKQAPGAVESEKKINSHDLAQKIIKELFRELGRCAFPTPDTTRMQGSVRRSIDQYLAEEEQ